MALNRKIAYINLSNGEVETAPISLEMRKLYLGGRGMDMYLLYNHTKKGIDPLGPDNVLLVSAGILGATLASASARTHVAAKSPLTGFVGSTNMGGFFAPELRWAGFDHLVIKGKAKKPVYLWINDGVIEIRDASNVWGQGVFDTQESIRQELEDEEVKVMCCGPAGENLVRFANVMTGLKNAGGRTGMGAVMGSKNLKAIAVRGTMDIEIKHPEQALAYDEQMINKVNRTKFAQIMQKWGTMFIYGVTNSTGLRRGVSAASSIAVTSTLSRKDPMPGSTTRDRSTPARALLAWKSAATISTPSWSATTWSTPTAWIPWRRAA